MDTKIIEKIVTNFGFITILVYVFGLINLVRTSFLLFGIELYKIKLKSKPKLDDYLKNGGDFKGFPNFSIIIPAYNEELGIRRSLQSTLNQDYPKHKYEVIVVNDGSKDRTKDVVNKFIEENKGKMRIKLVNQKNKGKARALNNGIINHSKNGLIMCLDADSGLRKDALMHISFAYKNNPRISASASTVQIIRGKGFMNLVQRFEYLICYQMKKAHTELNIEYIIGGIGSVFRRKILKKVNYYDTNTVTEDIDLTMKILKLGSKKHLCVLIPEAVAETEYVPNINDLIKQRFRWKWGRSQTFIKSHEMFFNKSKFHSKLLTFVYLPYAILGDITYLFEPLLLGYIIITSIVFNNFTPVLGAFSFFAIYSTLNIFADKNITNKDRFIFMISLPINFILSYIILSYAEYIALIKAILKINTLKKSIGENKCGWTHVQRLNLKD